MTNKELLNYIDQNDLNREIFKKIDKLQKEILTHNKITFEDQIMMIGSCAMLNNKYEELDEKGKEEFDKEFNPIFDDNWGKWYQKNQAQLQANIKDSIKKVFENVITKAFEN